MLRCAVGLLCACLLAMPVSGQTPAAAPQPTLSALVTEGITVFTPTEIRWTLHLEDNAPLPAAADDLAAQLQRRYAREGYTEATVHASMDGTSGKLTLTADEGRIDDIAFEGVDQKLAQELRDAFSVRPGDVFNTRQISAALRKLLAPAGGALALRDSRKAEPGVVFQDTAELRGREREQAFDLVDRDNHRTLVVQVRRRGGDFDATIGTESHEDWYSPADGLNLALGFGGTAYDQRRFNHTYVQGYLSYKFARDAVGYSLGFERPLFGGAGVPRLLVNADVHDTTSSDDFWRLSVTEQSLVSLTFKNSFRDYYVERGYQLGAAFQPNDANELRISWRANRHEPLSNEADYSLFRDDQPFRENRLAAEGKLRSIVFGYTLDSRGLEEESGRRRLARHTGPDLFGTFGGTRSGFRLEWTTEMARPGFGGDFDFSRHVANLRAYLPLSPAQHVRGRLIAGTSTGSLPPQRWFALGGIGTVHGYSFKESAGERMLLGNVEYVLGSVRDAHVLGFLDVGRVYRPLSGRDDWMKGIGVGFGLGDLRVDFGWRANDIPGSLQVLVRFGPTF